MIKVKYVISGFVFMALVFGVSSESHKAQAIGGFLKNKVKQMVPKEKPQATTAPAQEQQAEPQQTQQQSTVPVTAVPYTNAKYNYSFSYPSNWQLDASDPKQNSLTVIDTFGKKGNFIVTAKWMPEGFPVDPALKALENQAQQRKNHGELEEYYLKNYTIKDKNGKDSAIFRGVVTIESDIDPDMKRMQWIGYGNGNYYNFTWSSKTPLFPQYKETFHTMLESITFDFTK